MSDKKHIEEKISKLHFRAGAAMHDRILGDVLNAHDKSRNIKSAKSRSSLWRAVAKSRVTKLAAAAVIIVGVLIGIRIYSHSDTQPGEQTAKIEKPLIETPTVAKEPPTPPIQVPRTQPTAPEDDVVPASIKTMLAANDFDGVAAAVAKADLRTKVATANLLANMDDGAKALEVLDNLSAAHSGSEPDNPFAAAAVQLRNRITARQNANKAALKTTQAPPPLQEEQQPVTIVAQKLASSAAYPHDEEAETDVAGRRRILFGTVVDERGAALPDARVFASFALHDRTDANGSFALLISPTDGSNSLGPSDFPMYVWAWRENDPYRVAWTLIRRLRQEATQYPMTEETHQGVKLVIEDENLAQYIPGDPGRLFEESEGEPFAEGIGLQMGPAGVIMGQVTDASGMPVANATVRIQEFTLGLGMNTLTVNNLNHEWKADVSTVTDAQGYYQLSNLPISWTSVRLRAVLEGYGAGQAEYQGAGLSTVRGCDLQLTEGLPENAAHSDSSNWRPPRTGVPETSDSELIRSVISSSDSEFIRAALEGIRDANAEHFEDIQAGGEPVKGGGNSVVGAVPSGLQQNLVLYYSFYSNSDPATVTDISGRGFHGQVHGAAYDRDDVLGGTMYFDGDDDYVSVQGVSLGRFTFAAWVKTQTSGINNRRIFQLSNDENCYTVEGNAGGGLSSYVTRNIEINEYNWRFSKGTWAYVTVTFDGSSLKIYIYGVLTEARSGTFDQGIEGAAYIGGIGSFDGGFWNGNIDEVALFNRALTEDEVWQLFSMTGAFVETE